jgi:sugar phosphate isomerase/epimerase
VSNDRINRRQFHLGVAAAAVSAAVVGERNGAWAGDEPFRLNYILGSPMYGTTDLAEVLGEVKKTGAEWIDIWPRRHADHREQVEATGHERFLELLEQHNVRLGAITRYDLGPYGLQDEMRVLKKLGGRVIVTGARNAEGKTLRDQVKAFVDNLGPHVAVAEQLGVTIGIENHSNSLIHTPDSIRCFAEFAKSPHLGIALAPYHLPQEEETIARVITDLGPALVFFQAWQHGMGSAVKLPKEQELLQMPGRGPLDFTPLLAALKKINYQGFTEIFMHPVPRGIPILETTEAVTAEINRARDYLERCLSRV